MKSARIQKEIAHSRKLAADNPEAIWGWRSAAGKVRARRRADIIIKKARLKKGARILEVGCGTGVFTELFAETQALITAVDISQDLLNIAGKKKFRYGNVRFINNNLEDCRVDGPFDAVVGSSVLHHLDIGTALARIFELLTPGGTICFVEPNMMNPQIFLQKNIPWLKKRLGDSPDETAFVRWRFEKLLHMEKFVDIAITPFDWLHPATPTALINAVSNLGALLELLPFVREFAGSLIIYARRSS